MCNSNFLHWLSLQTSLMSLIISSIFILTRWSFPIDYLLIVKTLTFCWILISLSAFLARKILISLGFKQILESNLWSKTTLILIILTIILGWYLSVKVWGVEYLSPLQLEKVAINRGHQDTLFHVALTGIFLTSGQVSTGLDNTPFVPYHSGSHILFAGLSKLLSTHPLDTYALVYPVLIFRLIFHNVKCRAFALWCTYGVYHNPTTGA